jgi:transposase-like protein
LYDSSNPQLAQVRSQQRQESLLRELKKVYRADTKDLAALALDELADKWEARYPIVIASGRDNWEKLTTYFQYSASIRKLIYTTNAVEGYHRQIRKVTKRPRGPLAVIWPC